METHIHTSAHRQHNRQYPSEISRVLNSNDKNDMYPNDGYKLNEVKCKIINLVHTLQTKIFNYVKRIYNRISKWQWMMKGKQPNEREKLNRLNISPGAQHTKHPAHFELQSGEFWLRTKEKWIYAQAEPKFKIRTRTSKIKIERRGE